jgi:mannose-1-phosphate guanylyltransferase
VIDREILDAMAPAGSSFSIERDVFPRLIGSGLFGYEASGYWLDIGTPSRYLQGTFDILEGNVKTEVGQRLARAGGLLLDGTSVQGRVVAPSMLGPGCLIAEDAIVGCRAVLGCDVTVAAGAHVESSVLLDGVSVGARTVISSSIIGAGVTISDHCHIEGGVVLGDGVKVGAGNVLAAGVRIFPGVELPEGAIRF